MNYILKPLILLISYLCMVLLFISCAPIDINTTGDKSFDYQNLKSFAIIPNQQTDINKLPIDKIILDASIKSGIKEELTAKHFQLVSESADFIVSYYIVLEQKSIDLRTMNNYYSNIGYKPRGINSLEQPPHADVNVAFYDQGTLVIDIIDSKTKENIWRGSAQTPLGVHKEEEKMLERAKTITQKILNKFPPK